MARRNRSHSDRIGRDWWHCSSPAILASGRYSATPHKAPARLPDGSLLATVIVPKVTSGAVAEPSEVGAKHTVRFSVSSPGGSVMGYCVGALMENGGEPAVEILVMTAGQVPTLRNTAVRSLKQPRLPVGSATLGGKEN